ncbi:AraC-type DNA-binding protein [Caminicella sporogenes DSM 14501]|uniref:AraC-type DNA-binding protein n=1 Tax=Caminicella sporogenes DSM 14501 TaxID=1121266 RepID=A0A1M6TFQ1_9FIRM|nr:PocR ligand-binding domain-containing protein [Caminicella sporogenes]RKD24922.1 hypothetical protein BET04_11520 [Caminicella sporogenes]SHK55666.1 AraC-type DNA-binding protein [Caminicella sporogenes DSM 14501]
MVDKYVLAKEDKDIQYFDWGEVLWIHEPKIETHRLSAGLVKIFPKKRHDKHFHFGEEQILYVIQGCGIHKVNGKEEKIEKDMILHCPPYSEHEVINTEDSDLVFLIIYTPSKFMEISQNISILNRDDILKSIDIERLKEMQEEISSLLKLSVVITDDKKNNITDITNLNSFCKYCNNRNCIKKNFYLNSYSNELNEIYMCEFNVLSILVPILLNENIIGYLICGHLLINKSENIKEKIYLMAKNKGIDYEKLIMAYDSIPIVPKSRLYTLGELLTIFSKFISNVIEKDIIEQKLIEKNNEILEKTQQKMNLEKALNEAHIKLLKTKVTSTFKKLNFNERFDCEYKNNIKYPLEIEIQLEKAIKSLNKDESIKVFKDFIKHYEYENVSIKSMKDFIDEMFTVIIRTVYREVGDLEILSKIRQKYKEIVYKSCDYSQLLDCGIDFIEESIGLLKSIVLDNSTNLVANVNEYIKNNYMNDLTLNFIADVFYISPNYLSTIFNEKNNMSLTDYINKVRVEKAKEYLLDTDMKISVISKKVGYNNISYFSHIFKKITKYTPREYRLKNKL